MPQLLSEFVQEKMYYEVRIVLDRFREDATDAAIKLIHNLDGRLLIDSSIVPDLVKVAKPTPDLLYTLLELNDDRLIYDLLSDNITDSGDLLDIPTSVVARIGREDNLHLLENMIDAVRKNEPVEYLEADIIHMIREGALKGAIGYDSPKILFDYFYECDPRHDIDRDLTSQFIRGLLDMNAIESLKYILSNEFNRANAHRLVMIFTDVCIESDRIDTMKDIYKRFSL